MLPRRCTGTGCLVPGENDGGPQQLIQPAERWRPVLKVDQAAATLWFHPHPHGDTARQIYMGLTGMMIIDDGSDARLGLPRTFGVDDLPLILQDRQFNSDGSIGYDDKTLGLSISPTAPEATPSLSTARLLRSRAFPRVW